MSKIGRNDLCLCGSGKKYKKCCINKVDFFNSEDVKPATIEYLSYEKINQLNNEQIMSRLKANGIPMSEEKFLIDVRGTISAEEVSEKWFEKYDVTAKGMEEDFPWFAAWVLWDRLLPKNKLSLENMDDLLEKGTGFIEQNEIIKGVDLWLELWEAIKYYINPKYKNLDYLDERYKGSFFISNFVQDLEMEL